MNRNTVVVSIKQVLLISVGGESSQPRRPNFEMGSGSRVNIDVRNAPQWRAPRDLTEMWTYWPQLLGCEHLPPPLVLGNGVGGPAYNEPGCAKVQGLDTELELTLAGSYLKAHEKDEVVPTQPEIVTLSSSSSSSSPSTTLSTESSSSDDTDVSAEDEGNILFYDFKTPG